MTAIDAIMLAIGIIGLLIGFAILGRLAQVQAGIERAYWGQFHNTMRPERFRDPE